MIICCDIMSYVFGFFFGKTPLIKLSPKKTWEGFIGGAFSTVLFGIAVSYFHCFFCELASFQLSYALHSRPFFVCPLEDYYTDYTNCTVPPSFVIREFDLPTPISFVAKIFRLIDYYF